MKEIRGCTEEVAEYTLLDGISIRRCPLREITGETAAYLQAFQFYRRGIFPEAGGWLEQGMKAFEAFDLLDYWVGELMEKEQTREKWRSNS